MPSSVIQGMRYDPQSQVLDIVFRGGRGTYRYFDVAADEWMAFRSSSSKGTYLNTIFRAAKHRYERLDKQSSLFRAVEGPALQDLSSGNVWGFYEGR